MRNLLFCYTCLFLFALFLLALLPASGLAIVNIEEERIDSGEQGLQFKASVSLDITGGNTSENSYSLDSKTSYITETGEEYLLLWSQDFTKKNGVNSEDESFYHLRFALPWTENLYTEFFLQSEIDRYYNLLYRKLGGMGLRYRLGFEKDVYSHYMGLGGFYERESYQSIGLVQDRRANFYWKFSRVFKLEDGASYSIGQTLYYQPSLRRAGNIRGNWGPYIKFKINKTMKLKISLFIQYDSHPVFKTFQTDRLLEQSIEFKF